MPDDPTAAATVARQYADLNGYDWSKLQISFQCTHDSTNSPWYNKPATQPLLRIATDASHFYNQPKTQDLAPVFQAIGASLASASKLVQ